MNQFIQKTDKAAFVIPTKDVHRLNDSELEVLQYIVQKIDELRQADNQRPLSDNSYIICNKDEPYSEKVWQVILAGERHKMIADDETLREYADKELDAVLSQFPCPHCKSNEIFLEAGFSHIKQINEKGDRYFVICSGCGCTTDWVYSPVKAVELWCTRHGIKADLGKVIEANKRKVSDGNRV